MADLGVSVILQAVDKITAPVRQITKATGNLTTGFTDVQKRLADLNKKATQVQGFAELKKKTVDTHKAFTEATDKVSKLAREINKAEKPTKKLKQQFEKAKRQAGLLKQEHLKQTQGLHKLSASLKKAGVNTNKLDIAQRKLKTQASAATRALKREESVLRHISKLQESISGTQSKIHANLNKRDNLRGSLLDAAGLAASLALPIKAAIDFEDVMTDVTKNVANADFKTMRNAINDIAKQSPLGASGIGRLVSEAGKIGLASDKALEFAQISEKMAVAFELSADEAGQYITKFKASMGLSIDKIKELGDAINYLGDNTTSNAKNITQIVSRYGAIGLQAGLSKEQTAAFAAVLDGFAPNAENAGTAMKNLLTALASGEGASKPAQEALESLGFTAVGVAEMMQQDAAGTIRDVFAAIGDAPEEQRLSLLKVIVGDEAIGAAGGLVTNLQAYDDAMAKVANRTEYMGSVTAEYAKKAETAKHQMKVMRSNITVMGESIGRIMLPALNKLMSTITRITGVVADFTEKFPILSKAIIGITAVLLAGKVAAIGFGYAWTFVKGGMLSTLSAITKTRLAMTLFNKQISTHGRLAIVSQVTGLSKAEVMNKRFTRAIIGSKFSIKGLGSAMIGLATGGISKLIGGLKLLKVAVMTNPVTAAIAAAGFLIYKYWDHIKAFVGGVVEGFKSAATPIMQVFKPIQPLFSSIANAVGWVVNAISSLFQPVAATSEKLTRAANAGYQFGQFLAAGINLALTPLKLLLKGLEVSKSLWRWAFGDEDEQKGITVTKKIVQQVEQTGKIIPFPKQEQKIKGSPSDYRPLRATQPPINQTKVNANITVNAAPGMSEQEIARQIYMTLQEREHQARVQQRAALYGDSEYAIP